MAQTGFTPLLIYSSSTATNTPTAGNLLNNATGSELAINIADGKLFYKDSSNAVQVIGWKITPATAGGTGLTSFAVGDLIYADTTTTLAKLADVVTGNALISGGVGVAPSYGKIGLTTHVSGTLPTANGGTGLTGFTAANNAIYSTSSSVLTAGTLPVAAGGTGITTLTAGYIPYGNGTGAFSSNSGLFYDGSNLLVGTTTTISGSTCVLQNNGQYAGPQLVVRNNYNTAGKYWKIGQENNNSLAFYIYNASGVGQYMSDGGTSWLPNVSDERLKNKISDISNALEAVNKLKPLSFYYQNQEQSGIPNYGHFAQDVGNAIPDAMLVSPQKDKAFGDIYTYDPNIINVYLVKAVQELSAKFDAYVASHP